MDSASPAINVNFEHPSNSGLLNYLRRGASRRGVPRSVSPAGIRDPYYDLGTDPDVVFRFWDEITVQLPCECQWVVYGSPALVQPETGIIFGFAGGTHTYALRLPEQERHEALAREATCVHRYSDGSELDLSTIGEAWVFGGWLEGEERWCLAAYQFALAR